VVRRAKGGNVAGWLETLDRLAGTRAKAGLTRHLRPRPVDDPVVDLAGNDYLGLSRHPEVVAAAATALQGYGLGATGSRLVRGTTEAHAALETDLAGWLGAGESLVFSSGYLANLGAVRALAGKETLLVSDAYNHASLIDGCKLSGAETVVAPHADPDALGILGPSGAGGVHAAGLAGAPDVVVTATLSKSLGGAGGVVAGPAQLIRHLVDTGRTFIYDTALPPAVVAGVHAALGLARAADDRRAVLAARAAETVARLGAAGFGVSRPAAGVLSVPAPGPEAALAWAADCRDRGIAVGCFRPPSTPDGSSRLRLTLNAGVPDADFARALDVIVECAP
jgi:8-amino-7-oxononanoate synthase